MPRGKTDAMEGYQPLTWEADSDLGPEERETIENERRQLWRKGVRGVMLEELAFEFAFVITCQRLAKKESVKP